MYRRLSFLKHLEVLKKFYFCNQGDVISLFMQSVFNDDIESTVKENSVSFINNQLEIAIRLSQPFSSEEQDSEDVFGINSLINNFYFETTDKKQIKQNNFLFNAFNVKLFE